MAPSRLNLVRASPSTASAEMSQSPRDSGKASTPIATYKQADAKQLGAPSLGINKRSTSGAEESKSDSIKTEVPVVAEVVPSRKAVAVSTTAITTQSKTAPGSSGAVVAGKLVKSSSSAVSMKNSSSSSNSSRSNVFRPVQAPSFLRAPRSPRGSNAASASSTGNHSQGGELSLGTSDESDDVISWSDAGAAVVWHTQAFHCDLFEGHGTLEAV